MISICKFFISSLLILSGLASSAFSFEGPLQLNNLYPLFLHADQPYLEKAEIENSLSLGLSHSSTYTVDTSPEWTVDLDMEITELNFRYKRTINKQFEFGLDVPVLIFGGGFVDGFLEDFHRSFGFKDYGRSERPHNEFLYEVRKNGDLVIKGKSGTTIGDIRLAVKKPLVSSETYQISMKGDVEIPVSNADKGYSNGSVDGGISLLLDKSISGSTMTYWNLGVIFPGDVKGIENLDLRDFVYGGAAVETMLKDSLSLIVQLQGQSAIYPDTGIPAVDGEAFIIAFGGRYYSDDNGIELSLMEDLNTTGAPDFIFNCTYKQLL